MIYSKKYNFLYLKNKKVGGSSTEICLSQIMDKDAVVTPVYPIDERHSPRNHEKFFNHISYLELEVLIENLSEVDSCVVVRNPYDTVLSDFFLQLEYTGNMQNYLSGDRPDFANKYFENTLRKDWRGWLKSTKDLYSKDGTIQVKNVIKYEDGIEPGINQILEPKGLHLDLNVYQKAHRPKEITPKDVFSEKQMQDIAHDWAWEFDTFKYNL
jgi:hypothetical protein